MRLCAMLQRACGGRSTLGSESMLARAASMYVPRPAPITCVRFGAAVSVVALLCPFPYSCHGCGLRADYMDAYMDQPPCPVIPIPACPLGRSRPLIGAAVPGTALGARQPLYVYPYPARPAPRPTAPPQHHVSLCRWWTTLSLWWLVWSLGCHAGRARLR